MSAKVTIKLTGAKDLERKLKALPHKLRRQILGSALVKAAEPVREEMSRRARRAPGGPSHPAEGHLADNIVTARPSITLDGGSVNVGPGRDHFWGIFLEYGTLRMRAYPFARPAWESKGKVSLQILIKEIGKGLERVA